MIRQDDFAKIIKVFHNAVKEISQLDTFQQRKIVTLEWHELVSMVDHALANIIQEDNKEKRLKMVSQFEDNIKEFDYLQEIIYDLPKKADQNPQHAQRSGNSWVSKILTLIGRGKDRGQKDPRHQ